MRFIIIVSKVPICDRRYTQDSNPRILHCLLRCILRARHSSQRPAHRKADVMWEARTVTVSLPRFSYKIWSPEISGVAYGTYVGSMCL